MWGAITKARDRQDERNSSEQIESTDSHGFTDEAAMAETASLHVFRMR